MGRKETEMKTRDKLIGTGFGLAALAAAGAYLFYGKRGAANRDRVSGWARRVRSGAGDTLAKVEGAAHELKGRSNGVLAKAEGGASDLKALLR
jgi:hypothetical protein